MAIYMAPAAFGALSVTFGAHTIARGLPWANQDAHCLAPPFHAACFDGVSSAPRSRPYAAALAKHSRTQLMQNGDGAWSVSAQQALRQAERAAAGIAGASTACLIRVDLERKILGCYHLGDGGLLLLSRRRDGTMAISGRSVGRTHTDGSPFQLGGGGCLSDRVSDGLCSSYPLSPGQIALCYTDGLSQNLEVDEIVSLVGAASEAEPAAAIARRLAAAGRRRGTVDDDVTVVVARLRGGFAPSTSRVPWRGTPSSAATRPSKRLLRPSLRPSLRMLLESTVEPLLTAAHAHAHAHAAEPLAVTWSTYAFMLPTATAVATCCQLAGIGGAALFSPIFLLAFPLLGPQYPLDSPAAASASTDPSSTRVSSPARLYSPLVCARVLPPIILTP